MRNISVAILCFIGALLLTGCKTVPNHSLQRVEADTNGVWVTTPATIAMRAYDASIADHWERTLNSAAQRTLALGTELSVRDTNLTYRRAALITIGGLAGLGTSIYTGLTTEPRKEVIIPLGAISGTALISLIPILSKDDRLDSLQTKASKLNTLRTGAFRAFNELDRQLVTLAALQADLKSLESKIGAEADITTKAELEKRKGELLAKMKSQQAVVEQQISDLRHALNEWELASIS